MLFTVGSAYSRSPLTRPSVTLSPFGWGEGKGEGTAHGPPRRRYRTEWHPVESHKALGNAIPLLRPKPLFGITFCGVHSCRVTSTSLPPSQWPRNAARFAP